MLDPRSALAPLAAVVTVALAAPALAAPDFTGTYVYEGFTLTLSPARGGGYTGLLRSPEGHDQPLTLSLSGDTLSGTYTESDQTHPFTARLKGATLIISSNGETLRFTRQSAAPAPTRTPPAAPATTPPRPAEARPARDPANRPEPAAARPTFRRISGKGAAGAWLAELPQPGPAAPLVRGALEEATRALGASPTLRSAVVDQTGREAQAIFDAALPAQDPGAPTQIRGMVAVFPTPAGQAVALVYDHADRFGRTAPDLFAAVGAALPKPAAPDAGPIDPAALNWFPVNFADGSGSMRVPEGWTITHAANGGVDANGPHGAVSLGAAFQVYTPQGAQGWYARPPLVAPYTDPVTAIQHITPQLYQNSNQPAPVITRVVESQPAEYPGGQAAFIHLESEAQGQRYSSLTLVAMAPVSNDAWMYYMSTVVSPSESFGRNLPVLLEVWKNWRISDALMAQRLKKAVETMRETNEIMRQANEERSRTYDNINTAWGHVLRGNWPVEDTRDGERADIENRHLRPVIEGLNQAAGYERFREVPTQELNQWR